MGAWALTKGERIAFYGTVISPHVQVEEVNLTPPLPHTRKAVQLVYVSKCKIIKLQEGSDSKVGRLFLNQALESVARGRSHTRWIN